MMNSQQQQQQQRIEHRAGFVRSGWRLQRPQNQQTPLNSISRNDPNGSSSRLWMSSSSFPTTPSRKRPPQALEGISSDIESWETNVDNMMDDDNDVDDVDDRNPDEDTATITSTLDENNDDDDNGGTTMNPVVDEYWKWLKAINDAITILEKKRTSLHTELSKARGVEDTVARAQLLVSNLYLFEGGKKRTATVIDWENGGVEVELVLDSTGKYDSPSAEADALFTQARKLKRGSQVVATLLEETDRALEILHEAKFDLESTTTTTSIDNRVDKDDDDDDNNANNGPIVVIVDEGRLVLVKDRLTRTSQITKIQIPQNGTTGRDGTTSNRRRSSSSSNNSSNNNSRRDRKPEVGTPASNIRKLLSPGGCVVLVGRNRRGNENLSLNIARGNDIWMHSRGCPGAHVLIQNRRGGPKPSDACLQFGADLAIFYSDMRNEKKADVTAAEPKHILKPRGAPLGAIKIREEWRTFVGRPDQVPDELKQAREGSGQTDEYHMSDKAKHRRKTRQAAEEDRMKRKQQRKNNNNNNNQSQISQ